MRIGLFILLWFNFGLLLAQSGGSWVTVKGHDPAYAGYDLVMATIKNPISRSKQDLMVIRVQEDGHFEQSVKIAGITHASIDMGKYHGFIFLEPGQTYELILPPFKPRTDADRFNPYFVPEAIELGIANEVAQGLNRQIVSFNHAFDRAYNAGAVSIFARGDKQAAGTIIERLDSVYASQHPYFKHYKQYTYGKLHMLAYKRNKRTAMYLTLRGDSINMQMPAFYETFNTLFKNFFTSYFPSAQGEALRAAYARGLAFDSLSVVLQRDTLFARPELAELILLKGLYDGFYSGRYDEEPVIQRLNEARQTACSAFLQEVAADLYKQVTWLRSGTPAPPFTLFSLKGRERSLNDYEGDFVYLNFMHTKNHTCRQDLQLLDVLSKQLRRDIKIVTVIMDEKPDAAIQLIKENKYRWDFLHFAAMPGVALDYRLKALPTYFVIDPDQLLTLAPAPAPGENFLPIFMEAQRRYNYEQLRKDKPKEKSIYDF